MPKGKYYTSEEDEIIRKYYPIESPDFMETLLKRKYSAIVTRACRLSVSKNRESYECTKRWNGDIFKDVPEQNIWYLAGFIDGEGCIRISKSKHKKVNYTPIHLKVVIANTNKEIIEWIDKNTNYYGKIYTVNRKNPNHKTAYYWALSGNRKVVDFLNTMKEFLIVKKKQAELLSNGYLHLNEIERDNFINEIKKLNKRGN